MPDLPVYNASIALADNPAHDVTATQKFGLALVGLGLLGVAVALFSSLGAQHPILMLTLVGLGLVGGGLLYILDGFRRTEPGIRNEGVMFSSMSARGLLGWITGKAQVIQ